MIVDAFIFNNEFDILKARIDYLKDVVDYFVIVESNTTFTGNRKKLLSLFKFLGVRKKDNKTLIKIFKKPINVKIPKDFSLNKVQKKEFEKYCKTEMIKNGYNLKQSYIMKY